MRKLFLVSSLLTASVVHAFAQTPAKPAEQATGTEQTILKLTRDWLAAEEATDRATLRRIIADDFQGTAAMGHTVFKEDVIPQEGSRGGLAIAASDLKARVFGDTAVVSGHGITKGAEKRELRFTVVFARRGDSWQMVAGHLSVVPKE